MSESTESKRESCEFPWQHMPTPGKMYGTATVGERGQISIPADARKDLNINSGDKLVVFGNRINGAVILIKANIFEDFAEFFMTKLNKLGEHAQAFFDHLQPPNTDAEEPESAQAPEDPEESAQP